MSLVAIVLSIVAIVLVASNISSLKDKIRILEQRLNYTQGELNKLKGQAPTPTEPNINNQQTVTTQTVLTQSAPTQSAPTPTVWENPAPKAPAEHIPTPPQPTYRPPMPQVNTPKINNNVETVIGKNIIAWCAAVLIFIGLISFGVLVYASVSEGLKIFTLFAISTIITIIGTVLSLKKKNPFTITLTGCGLGSIYISILITHIHFEAINDTTSFALLLVWLVGSLLMAKLINSPAISIIAHIGMAISICVAYIYGLSDDKLLLILCYQIISSFVLIGGNLICCKKTYYAGLLVSFGITLVSSIAMNIYFSNDSAYGYGSAISVVAFLIQFMTSAVLTAIIALDTDEISSSEVKVGLQIANKFIFILSVILNILIPSFAYFDEVMDKGNLRFTLPFIICIGIFAIHFIVSFILARCKKIDYSFEIINAVFTTVCTLLSTLSIAFVLSLQGETVILSFAFIISIVMFIVYFFTKKKIYNLLGTLYLFSDLVFALIFFSGNMVTKFSFIFALGYFVFLMLIMACNYLFISDRSKNDNVLFKTFCYLTTYLSLIFCFGHSDFDYSGEFLLMILNILTIISIAVKFGKNSKGLTLLMHIVENSLLSANFFTLLAVGFSGKNFDSAEEALFIIISFLAIAVAFARVYEYYTSKQKEGLFLFLGIKVTLLILVAIHASTNVFNEQFTFSLILMFIALICIVSGFALKIKSIRLYGLIVTLICVLKLAVIDISGEDTMLRILALIGGGVICFAISALYSYMNKRLETTNKDTTFIA